METETKDNAVPKVSVPVEVNGVIHDFKLPSPVTQQILADLIETINQLDGIGTRWGILGCEQILVKRKRCKMTQEIINMVKILKNEGKGVSQVQREINKRYGRNFGYASIQRVCKS